MDLGAFALELRRERLPGWGEVLAVSAPGGIKLYGKKIRKEGKERGLVREWNLQESQGSTLRPSSAQKVNTITK